VITRDVCFANATLAATRGLLTWNRSSLLYVLPNSRSTISEYVKAKLEERTVKIGDLLCAGSSRFSISVKIWISSNHSSFLGVVAHFANKQSMNSTLSFVRQSASLLPKNYSSSSAQHTIHQHCAQPASLNVRLWQPEIIGNQLNSSQNSLSSICTAFRLVLEEYSLVQTCCSPSLEILYALHRLLSYFISSHIKHKQCLLTLFSTF
jgi:hypothetical protein